MQITAQHEQGEHKQSSIDKMMQEENIIANLIVDSNLECRSSTHHISLVQWFEADHFCFYQQQQNKKQIVSVHSS